MNLRHTMPAAVALTAAILAGCGGGGSDNTAVSSSPAASSTTPVATPAPTATTIPTPTPAPAATPDAAATPTTPAAPAVARSLILTALYTSVSPDPNRLYDPYSNARRVTTADGQRWFDLIGGSAAGREAASMTSFVIADGFPSANGLGYADQVSVVPEIVNGVVQSVTANGLRYTGSAVTLSSGEQPLDSELGTWTLNGYSVKLLVMSVPGQTVQMRVCWNVNLPPPAAVTGPTGYVPPAHLVRTDPLLRLMCGVYGQGNPAQDIGGFVIDDRNGTVSTYQASW